MKKQLLLILLAMAGNIFCYAQTKQKTIVRKTSAPVAASNKTTVTEPVPEAEPDIKPMKKEAGREVVAIYHCTTSREYSYDYAQSVGNAIETGFVQSNRFTVAERNRFGAIKEEEKFKEANTSLIVKAASKLGAKYIVAGHVNGISKGGLVDSYGKNTGDYTSISFSFKIIEVETGEIKYSETINARGESTTAAASLGNAYTQVQVVIRNLINTYFPQRFGFMSVVTKGSKKKYDYLETFKIWGGSAHGLKVGDFVEISVLSYVINPNTQKKLEEKKVIGYATVLEINSPETSTCKVYKASRLGEAILNAITTPETVIIEYKGQQQPRGFWDSL